MGASFVFVGQESTMGLQMALLLISTLKCFGRPGPFERLEPDEGKFFTSGSEGGGDRKAGSLPAKFDRRCETNCKITPLTGAIP